MDFNTITLGTKLFKVRTPSTDRLLYIHNNEDLLKAMRNSISEYIIVSISGSFDENGNLIGRGVVTMEPQTLAKHGCNYKDYIESCMVKCIAESELSEYFLTYEAACEVYKKKLNEARESLIKTVMSIEY